MSSMKTLAYMETRKLTRFLGAQEAVVASIEDVATDLLSFHPEILPEITATTSVYILLGTERGFCGDFNQVVTQGLLQNLDTLGQEHPRPSPMLIAVGRKLHNLLEMEKRVAICIDGAGVAEEVPAVLKQLVAQLSAIQDEHGMLTVRCVYQQDNGGVQTQALLPPFQHLLHQPSPFHNPPLLNQTPRAFIAELTDHYLFAALHKVLYTSLMAENHRRVAHLEGAMAHLDEQSEKLTRQCNTLRQEEITEEIEVMLLNAVSLGEEPEMRVANSGKTSRK